MPFRRVFVRRYKGIWIINILVTLGCGIAYILIDGKQLVYSLFIPLDIFLNFGRGVFYWYYYFLDKKQKAEEAHLKARLAEGVKETPLLDQD